MLLAHLSRQAHKGELIVYPCSGVRRRRRYCCRCQQFQALLRHNAGQEGRGEILLENSFMR